MSEHGHPARPGDGSASPPPPRPGEDPFASLRGEVVLVTGAAQGIGAAVRDAFAARGALVVGADVVFDEGGPTRVSAAASGDLVPASRWPWWRVHVDVTDESSVDALVRSIEADPGLGTVGVLVHCAGSSTMARVVDTTLADWEFNQSLNARGSFLTARAVVRGLESARRPGRVILVASQAATNGFRLMGAYVASKHAVLGLVRTLALEEAASGTTVNAVCPGIVETAMKHRERVEGAALRGITPAEVEAEDRSQVPLGRTAQPEDVAGVCLFLASDLASHMTGLAVNVSGGMTMH